MTERDLIDIDKIADMLHLNRKHVRDRTSKRADFPRVFRVGQRKLYDREEILEWIDSHQQAPDGRRTPTLRHTASQAA
ncbi:Helix-turn-helix domain protein [compost metagenome]|jgi:predicted DNA-binding transcriptional regulator AlpA